jgi:hypothetical protein
VVFVANGKHLCTGPDLNEIEVPTGCTGHQLTLCGVTHGDAVYERGSGKGVNPPAPPCGRLRRFANRGDIS